MRRLYTALALSLALFAPACSSPGDGGVKTPAVETAGELSTFTSDSAGFDTHSFYYDTGSEVVVFDAQFTPDLANKLIASIRAETSSRIAYVVVTHPNPDKFNGAPAFQAIGAKVVASKATADAIPGVHQYKKYYFVEIAKAFTDATYPPEAKIDITFSGDYDLPLSGGARIKLHELSASGVSSTQTVAYIPVVNALMVGDLVHHKAHAWLEGGIVNGAPSPNLKAWKSALGELTEYSGAKVYGGRGEPALVADAVKAEDAYLTEMDKLVRDYATGLGDKRDELKGPKAGEHYKAIADLAAKKFPDYAFPYLIEYGVYGLVNSILAETP